MLLEKRSESRSVVSNSLRPHELYSAWNSPGQNTGVGCCCLLQGILSSQELSPGLCHSSTLAWKIPWTEKPGVLQSMGPLESDMTEWLHFQCSLSCTGWRIAGTAEPSGLRSMGLQRVGHDWSDLAAAAAPTLQGYSLPAKPPEKPVDKYEWINQGHQYDRILFNFLKEYILEYLIICAILMTHYFKIMYAVIDI